MKVNLIKDVQRIYDEVARAEILNDKEHFDLQERVRKRQIEEVRRTFGGTSFMGVR